MFSILANNLLFKAKNSKADTSWSLTTPLNFDLASHVSFYTSGKIFSIAGATNVVNDIISYATINPDNNLNTWLTDTINYDFPIFWHSLATKNSFIYILGGSKIPVESVDNVYLIDVSTGLLSSFISQTPLPQKLSLGGVVVAGNYIYYLGGFHHTGTAVEHSNAVYFTSLGTDGTVGSWSETTSLPEPLSGFGSIASGNKITVFGGSNSSWAPSNAVYEAEINPVNGTLGNWSVNPNSMIRPTARSGYTKLGNLVVSAGGIDESEIFSDVYYAEIQANGSLGPWTQSLKSLGHPLCCGSLAASDTHFYYTGGHDGGGYFNTVYFTSKEEIIGGQTPTPIPRLILNVPNLKQFYSPESLWGNNQYDHTSKTIEDWGCALTSATMVLRYYNHNIFPDELNQWLNENNGYNREGGVVWPAISVYSLKHTKKINTSIPLKHLEWKRVIRHDNTVIDNQFSLQQPVILNVPGHFVVAKGKTNNNYYINDPASNTNSLLSEVEEDHGGEYWKIETFNQVNTDLSYIYLLVNENVNIEVFDPIGNKIEEGYAVEEPINSDSGVNTPSGLPLNSFALPKPENGYYKVLLSGNNEYQLDAYLYDEGGDLKLVNLFGDEQTSNDDIFLISFDKSESAYQKISYVSLDSLLTDLDEAYEKGKFKNHGFHVSLSRLILNAEKLRDKNNIFSSNLLLSLALERIRQITPEFIDDETSLFLQQKIKILLESE